MFGGNQKSRRHAHFRPTFSVFCKISDKRKIKELERELSHERRKSADPIGEWRRLQEELDEREYEISLWRPSAKAPLPLLNCWNAHVSLLEFSNKMLCGLPC